MLKYNKLALNEQAKEMGVVRDTLEKALRLFEVLRFINGNDEMRDCLALKGGTAINLVIFSLPRLSVDIDLDFTENLARIDMMQRRSWLTETLGRYMNAQGYALSRKTKTPHSLDSFVYSYENAAGVNDNIKIEINYSLRAHILPAKAVAVNAFGYNEATPIRTLAPIEIYASKIIAYMARAAARDLYDLNNMIYYGLFDDSELPMLRKSVIFYSAIAMQKPPQAFCFKNADAITAHMIHADLQPVLSRTEHFDLDAAKKRVTGFLTALMQPNEKEWAFLRNFAQSKYEPALLFDDAAVLARIHDHPMALWKTRAIKAPER